MVTAAWDSSNLVALYRNGVQCTSCCFEGYEPDFCCPGFGSNQTPSQYTVKIDGVTGAGAPINGTWILDLIECEVYDGGWPEDPSCVWLYKEAEEEGNIRVSFVRGHSLICAEIDVGGWIWLTIGEVSTWWSIFSCPLLSFTFTTGWCTDAFVNYPNPGTAEVWPLSWPAWGDGESYQPGDPVNHNDVLYLSLVAHTAVAVQNEPGVGINQDDFWEVADDPCGDANVACP